MIQYIIDHAGEIVSLFTLLASIFAGNMWVYKKLHAEISSAHGRIDSMGARIDAMGQRIDNLYHVMMSYLIKDRM